jgi:uncharacterized protein (DUF1697 family)
VNTYVAFMRAINVAGHATVRMTDLKEAFASAGCEQELGVVATSGNWSTVTRIAALVRGAGR